MGVYGPHAPETGVAALFLLNGCVVSSLFARLGAGRTALAGAALCSAAVAPPGVAGSLGVLVATCVVLGAANGMLDVAMNVRAVEVEADLGRPILSRMHALFSVGMRLGAGSAAVVAGLGIERGPHLGGVAALGLLATTAVAAHTSNGCAIRHSRPAGRHRNPPSSSMRRCLSLG